MSYGVTCRYAHPPFLRLRIGHRNMLYIMSIMMRCCVCARVCAGVGGWIVHQDGEAQDAGAAQSEGRGSDRAHGVGAVVHQDGGVRHVSLAPLPFHAVNVMCVCVCVDRVWPRRRWRRLTTKTLCLCPKDSTRYFTGCPHLSWSGLPAVRYRSLFLTMNLAICWC
jgi:hypothetical protein